jgi:hypothetical protein
MMNKFKRMSLVFTPEISCNVLFNKVLLPVGGADVPVDIRDAGYVRQA